MKKKGEQKEGKCIFLKLFFHPLENQSLRFIKLKPNLSSTPHNRTHVESRLIKKKSSIYAKHKH